MDRRIILSVLLGVVTALFLVTPAPAVSHNDFAPSMLDPYSNLCDIGECSPLYAVVSRPHPEREFAPPTHPILQPRPTGDAATSVHSMMATGDARAAAFGNVGGGGQIIASSAAGGRGVAVSPLSVRRELGAVLRQLGL